MRKGERGREREAKWVREKKRGKEWEREGEN